MLIGDSAFPPATYPTEYDGVPIEGWCPYIPGGDAYHGWTPQELARLMAQPHIRYIVPVFVRSNPQGAAQAAADVATVVAWARANGQPRGTLTMMDYETAVDAPYELTFDADLHAEDGDLEILYGSKGTVINNPAPSGAYDEAQWTGQIPTSLASMAEQFYSGNEYDLNKFRDDAPLWDLRPATTPPAPSAHSQEDDVSTTSVSGRAGLAWPEGARHVFEANYAAAGESDLVLGVELKLVSGPLYAPDFTVSHLTGTGAYEIPAEHVGNCRGVILTVKSGPKGVVYDACAA